MDNLFASNMKEAIKAGERYFELYILNKLQTALCDLARQGRTEYTIPDDWRCYTDKIREWAKKQKFVVLEGTNLTLQWGRMYT